MILINNFRICFMLALVCAAGIAPSLAQEPGKCKAADGSDATCEAEQFCSVEKAGAAGCKAAADCPEGTAEEMKCAGGKCCCKAVAAPCNADLTANKMVLCGEGGVSPTGICDTATGGPGPSGGGGGAKKCKKGNGTDPAMFDTCTGDQVCFAKSSTMYEGCADKSMCPNSTVFDGTCKDNKCCCEPMGEMGCNITGSAHRFFEGHYGGFSLVTISAILMFFVPHKSSV